MAAGKKRILHNGTSNPKKNDGNVTKNSLRLPPGALKEIVAEKKRRLTSSKVGVVHDNVGGSKHVQDLVSQTLPRKKKSVRGYAASAKIIMDSPPSMSRRSDRGLLSVKPTPEG